MGIAQTWIPTAISPPKQTRPNVFLTGPHHLLGSWSYQAKCPSRVVSLSEHAQVPTGDHLAEHVRPIANPNVQAQPGFPRFKHTLAVSPGCRVVLTENNWNQEQTGGGREPGQVAHPSGASSLSAECGPHVTAPWLPRWWPSWTPCRPRGQRQWRHCRYSAHGQPAYTVRM